MGKTSSRLASCTSNLDAVPKQISHEISADIAEAKIISPCHARYSKEETRALQTGLGLQSHSVSVTKNLPKSNDLVACVQLRWMWSNDPDVCEDSIS